MAATFTPTKVDAYTSGNKKVRIFDVAVSGTYTTGGDTVPASLFGLHRMFAFLTNGATDGSAHFGVLPVFAANQGSVSLKQFSGGAERASSTSLASNTFRVTVVGV